MNYYAKVVADSVGPNGARVTTLEFDIWKPLIGELNTHGLISRNFGSSRAISWERVLGQVMENPHIPQFRKAAKEMQPGELLNEAEQQRAAELWLKTRNQIVATVEVMGEVNDLGVHKQWLNRLLEPFMIVRGLATATCWKNFFNLRLELNEDGFPMAQDEFYFMARAMKEAIAKSTPDALEAGGLHLPYVDSAAWQWLREVEAKQELGVYFDSLFVPSIEDAACFLSAGKCAVVSYNNLGQGVNHGKDLKRAAQTLLPNGHMSVFQHQGIMSDEEPTDWSGNFWGVTQFRKTLPGEQCWESPRAHIALDEQMEGIWEDYSEVA